MATQLPDGRWQARYRAKGMKPLVWYGLSEEEAESQKEAYLNPQPHIPWHDGRTLQEFVEEVWWPAVESSVKESSRRRYDQVWNVAIGPRFGDMPIKEVTFPLIQQWVLDLKRSQKAPRTIKLYRGTLSTILNLAVNSKLITENPASKVKIPAVVKRKRVMTLEKAIELLRAVEGTNLHGPVFCSMFLGMRRGEACGLKWSSIDQKSRRIHVCEQRLAHRRDGKIVIEQAPLKVDSADRAFVLPEKLFELYLKSGDWDSEWFCTARAHRPWNPEKLSEKWSSKAKGFGLEEWSYHDLRHATAGLLVALGVDLLTVASILGHTNVDTTQLYALAQESTATLGFKKLEDALLPVDASSQVASEMASIR